MSLDQRLLEVLACPEDKGPLWYFEDEEILYNPRLRRVFAIDNGIPVLLIDEIDKADIEFPNDLLLELDRMEFFVYETQETVVANVRPIVVITSNNEKELPDAFLRRCFFHHIAFPDRDVLEKIISVHIPKIKKKL